MSSQTNNKFPEWKFYSEFGTATIHEAAGGIGALPSSIKPLSRDFRLFGAAFTVKSPPADNLWLHRAIYAAPTGSVLVVSVEGFMEAGHWGAVMGRAALARGIAGLVIDGGIRDSRELIAMRFPVFAPNVCIRGTAKDRSAPGALGERIIIGEIGIETGDLIIGDADGVVAIPAAISEQVLEKARDREKKESDIFARLEKGETTLDIYRFVESPVVRNNEHASQHRSRRAQSRGRSRFQPLVVWAT